MNAGYISNKIWSAIESMYVVHPRSDIGYWWKIPLFDEPQTAIDFSPSADSPTAPTDQRARWQLKTAEGLPMEQTNEPAS